MFNLLVLKLLLITIINTVFGGVLILSPNNHHSIETMISSLKSFDIESYERLKDYSNRIITFQINTPEEQIPDECVEYFNNKFNNTSYLPNNNIILQPDNNIIILNNSPHENCNEIRNRMILEEKNPAIFLIMMSSNSFRMKRENNESDISKSIPQFRINPDEPVLYNYEGRALLYSSRALSLKLQLNDTTNVVLLLGAATAISLDARESYSRLVCTIPVEEGKVVLRFRFPWDNDNNWSLTSVEVVMPNVITYNLTTTTTGTNTLITAPKSFSYGCGGETIFTDGSVSLILYDLQVQPSTKDHHFADAYNCVPFMTEPICSGIFVTTILAIGLVIGFGALANIKSMDKFDTVKTKQLTIISE